MEKIENRPTYSWVKSKGDREALKCKVLFTIRSIRPTEHNVYISPTWGQVSENSQLNKRASHISFFEENARPPFPHKDRAWRYYAGFIIEIHCTVQVPLLF